MSVRLGILAFVLLDHFNKIFEQIHRVMRTGRSFRVILDREQRIFLVAQSFDGLIIKILMDHFNLRGIQALHINTEPMVLRRDADAVVLKIFDRMIGAVMAEFQFVCFPAERETDDLVTQANSKNGKFADEFTRHINDIRHNRGIAGAVGNKKAVGFDGHDFFIG